VTQRRVRQSTWRGSLDDPGRSQICLDRDQYLTQKLAGNS
jgi:hypothetical protein